MAFLRQRAFVARVREHLLLRSESIHCLGQRARKTNMHLQVSTCAYSGLLLVLLRSFPKLKTILKSVDTDCQAPVVRTNCGHGADKVAQLSPSANAGVSGD